MSKSSSSGSYFGLKPLLLSVGAAFSIVAYLSWKKYSRSRRRARRLKNGNINIGGIFGMDVGGTLTKIVYFEAKINGNTNQLSSSGKASNQVAASHTLTGDLAAHNYSGFTPESHSDKSESNCVHSCDHIERSDSSKPTLKRSASLNKLNQPDHQEALQQLYQNMSTIDETQATTREDHLSLYSSLLGGRLHFLHFETRNMVAAIQLLSATAITENIRTIGCTGGGAVKYAKMFQDELGITFSPQDELASLVTGMHFALTNVPGECYTYRSQPVSADEITEALCTDSNNDSIAGTPKNNSRPGSNSRTIGDANAQRTRWSRDVKERTVKVVVPFDFSSPHPLAASANVGTTSETSLPLFDRADRNGISRSASIELDTLPSAGISSPMTPYLVVNVGTGVSILKVTSPTQFERVSGSSLGGGTYWGLCRLLTHCTRYEEVLDMAEAGDASEVDMLVKDIYGGDYDAMHLNGKMVASSFGKLVMKDDPREGIKEEDLAIALLMMITNNIGQVAYLNAKLHNCTKIFFVGSFLRLNAISCRRLAFAIDFWSNGEMEALFSIHEGYFGALGTFLRSAFGDDLDQVLAQDSQNRRYNEAAGTSSKVKSVTTYSRQHVTAESEQTDNGLYGLDRAFLENLRKWRPLSFNAFRQHKQQQQTLTVDTGTARPRIERVVSSKIARGSEEDTKSEPLINSPMRDAWHLSMSLKGGSGTSSSCQQNNDDDKHIGYSRGSISIDGIYGKNRFSLDTSTVSKSASLNSGQSAELNYYPVEKHSQLHSNQRPRSETESSPWTTNGSYRPRKPTL